MEGRRVVTGVGGGGVVGEHPQQVRLDLQLVAQLREQLCRLRGACLELRDSIVQESVALEQLLTDLGRELEVFLLLLQQPTSSTEVSVRATV